MVNSYGDINKPNRRNHLRQNKGIGIIPVVMEWYMKSYLCAYALINVMTTSGYDGHNTH